MIIETAKATPRISLVLVMLLLMSVGSVYGHDLSISDSQGLSTIIVDAHTGMGLKNWTIAGVNHMARQWYWFTGNQSEVFKFNAPLGISPMTLDTRSQSADPGCIPETDATCLHHHIHHDTNQIHICYGFYNQAADRCSSQGPVSVNLYYTIDMKPGNMLFKPVPRVSQRVIITNQRNTSTNIVFILYSHFIVDGDTADNTAEVPKIILKRGKGAITGVRFLRDDASRLIQTKTHRVDVEVLDQTPDHWEIGQFQQLVETIECKNFSCRDLADKTSPMTGDVAHAIQFNISLDPNPDPLASNVPGGASFEINIEEREP